MTKSLTPVICLIGPTASGKTPLAIEIVERFPCEIISVDSAMVYKGMNIGTAKPTLEELQRAPHHLIDLLDPKESYSAGQFRLDALAEMDACVKRGKIPLLVGGTMLYFRVLQQGIAELPKANEEIRAHLKARALKEGWETLHAELNKIDPVAANHIQPRDSQRIQRALEVYLLTGKAMSVLQATQVSSLVAYQLHTLGLMPLDRAFLHQRIAQRFFQMLDLGFIAEVESLYNRKDLSVDLPSIRSVGYRQIWDYLSGLSTQEEMQEKALAATRQLAKRQMTWMRPWENIQLFDAGSAHLKTEIFKLIDHIIKQ